MAQRRVLFVNWHSINGAAQGKRKLVLRRNDDNTFTCPVNFCLHTDFKSKRGLRKHIDNKHSWFYYFDEQPDIKREEIEELQPVIPKKASTINKPFYSMEEGIGNDFLEWLCTSCGGGKSQREAKQVAKRALKFLMSCTGDNDSEAPLSNELIDCCLGSAAIIIRFLTVLEKEWKLSFSGSLNYIRSIEDLLDFRKANGVTDSNLRCFAVTEVYLRRAKENFRKKKRLECTRNFDFETLVARDSWATIEEMERVIPFHIENFKSIVERSKSQSPLPTKHELSFCTRFVTTFLFLRVKCSRPMTFQFLTLSMIDKARVNKGFIDQTEFKTAAKYVFDTLIITPDVFTVLDAYTDYVRPLFNPVCNYLLISNTGNQYQSLTTAMTMLVHQAIGKYIHPTRYRQIVETTSADRLTRAEQETISEDQKHSSTVAKIYYKKKQSRNVALEGKRCMEKMLGDTRNDRNNDITTVLSELKTLNSRFINDPVIQKSSEIICNNHFSSITPFYSELSDDESHNQLNPFAINTSPYGGESSCTITKAPDFGILAKAQNLLSSIPETPNLTQNDDADFELEITETISPAQIPSRSQEYSKSEISSSVEIKREVAAIVTKRPSKNVKFTIEEDRFLKQGITKYGLKSWSLILKDKEYNFHKCRTRDSLRVRADSIGFKKSVKFMK